MSSKKKSTFSIYVINSDDKVCFVVESGLSLSMANRLCVRFNETWSSKLGDKETCLNCILGYCVSDKDDLSYRQCVIIFNKQVLGE